jgi:prepilin-type N-terminal cleavage/methylation domain-containing protein
MTPQDQAALKVARSARFGALNRGDTLLEVLISVMILGIAGTAVMFGFGNSITLSSVQRKLASASADNRNFGEQLVNAIDSGGVYQPCVDPITSVVTPSATILSGYSSVVSFTPGLNNAVTLTAIDYWNGTSFVPSCPTKDQGVQRVRVSITNTDTRASSTVQVVIRKPCTLPDVTAGPCP